MTIKQIKEKAKLIVKEGKNHGNLLLSNIISGLVSLVPLAGNICAPCIGLGNRQVYLDAVNGKETDLRTLYSKFKKQFGSSFLLMLCGVILIIAALVAILIVGVFLTTIFSIFRSEFMTGLAVTIIIILGIIVLYYAFLTVDMSCHVLLRETEIDGVEALKKGWALASKNAGLFLRFELSFFGWFLLALITFGLVFIYTIPYYGVAATLLLEQIYNGTSKEELDKAASESFKETAAEAASSIKATASATASVVSDAAVSAANNISSKIEEKKNENAAAAQDSVCPSCGAKNLPDSLFCEKCGTKLK